MFSGTAPFDDLETHTVLQNLRLVRLLGVDAMATVKAPFEPLPRQYQLQTPYVVIHPFPKFEYKKWQIGHWQSLIDSLSKANLHVVISGGPDSEERHYNSQLVGATNLTGCLSLAELSGLLAGAKAYVGPDTATTHMAASLGIPTVAIFGPSNPVKWGPWPADDGTHVKSIDQSPWRIRGSQRIGSVVLLQGPGDCVPCRLEGCDRHVGSRSECLEKLEPAAVLKALRDMNVLDG
jgi:heptosyltransferase-3